VPNLKGQAPEGIFRENLPAETQLQKRYFVGHYQLGGSTERCSSAAVFILVYFSLEWICLAPYALVY